MEYGTIERQIHVEAPPEVVFEVVSRPEHLQEWWSDEAELESAAPGATGELSWGDRSTPEAKISRFTVVDADPPRSFSFRWVYPDGEVPGPDNSLLVAFELVPSGTGTTVRLTETGFRERGWEVAVLEEHYRSHSVGWDTHLPRLGEYVERLASSR